MGNPKRKQPDTGTSTRTSDQSADAGSLLEGLRSLDPYTRESSCVAVASLFSHLNYEHKQEAGWSSARKLLQEGLVRVLLQRLSDPLPSVRLPAAGALRNVASCGDAALCESMVLQDDVITPVLSKLADIVSSTDVPVKATSAQVEATAVQLTSILVTLFETVDAAVTRFTAANGAQAIMALLQHPLAQGSSELFGCALQLAHTATESNTKLVQQLSALPEAMGTFANIAKGTKPAAAAATSATAGAAASFQYSSTHRLQAAGVLLNAAGAATAAAASAPGATAASATAVRNQSEVALAVTVVPLAAACFCYRAADLQQLSRSWRELKATQAALEQRSSSSNSSNGNGSSSSSKSNRKAAAVAGIGTQGVSSMIIDGAAAESTAAQDAEQTEEQVNSYLVYCYKYMYIVYFSIQLIESVCCTILAISWVDLFT
jgi:hypothetical protein